MFARAIHCARAPSISMCTTVGRIYATRTFASEADAAAAMGVIKERLARRTDELNDVFSGHGVEPHVHWANTYREHRRSELLVPAMHAFFPDPQVQPDAQLEGFLIGMASEILSQLSPDESADASFRMLVHGIVPRDMMLGICRLSRGEANQALFQRYTDTLAKAAANDPESVASVHIRNTLSRLERVTPGASLADELLPHTAVGWIKPMGMKNEVVGGSVLAGGKAHALETSTLLRQMLVAAPVGDAAKEAEEQQQHRIAAAEGGADDLLYWTMSSMAHLGLLSGAYSASGDLAYLRRMADMAKPWGEASIVLRDAGQGDTEAALLSDMAAVMPSALALNPNEPVDSDRNALFVRASVARAVINHLLEFVQTNPDILKVLAEECADLKEALPITAATPLPVIHRLRVFPKALHLMSLTLLKAYDDDMART